MKTIIITENQCKCLLENMGNVSYFDKLMEYITNASSRSLNRLLLSKMNGINVPENDVKQRLKALFQVVEKYNISKDMPIDDLVIDEDLLIRFGINNIKQVTIEYIIDYSLGGGFDNNSIGKLTNDNKIDNITIIANLAILFLNRTDFIVMLRHEFTHAFEIIQRVLKNGLQKTQMSFNNKYYSTQVNDFINNISYYFSKTEMNAFVSEAYKMLNQSNVTDLNGCYDLLFKNEHSSIREFRKELSNIYQLLSNDIYYTKKIVEFIRRNPEHVDMFPSIKGRSVESYQRRLVKVAYYKISYFDKKINRIIKLYLNDITKKSAMQ